MNRIRPLALGAILIAVAGCTSAGAPPTSVPSPGATVGPPSTTTSAPAASAPVTPEPAPATPEPSPQAPDPTPPPPVAATLSLGDGPPVEAEVGSYTIDGFGSDSPWLPASSLEQILTVHVGSELRIRLDGDQSIEQWSVSAARAEDTHADGLIGLGDGDAAPQAGAIVVGAPPAGDWVVMASVRFAGGSGAYYWHVVVTK